MAAACHDARRSDDSCNSISVGNQKGVQINLCRESSKYQGGGGGWAGPSIISEKGDDSINYWGCHDSRKGVTYIRSGGLGRLPL